MSKDDTITLPVGMDFQRPGENNKLIAKLFEGEALKRVWALLDIPTGRPRISEVKQG